MVQFHALGGVAITDEDREVNVGGPRQRRLLAMLLIHRNAVVSVDRLADAVFAGEPTPAASTTLRSYVARVRKVIESNGSLPAVVTQAPGYMLRLPDEVFDVARFEAALAEARSLLSRSEAAEAAQVVRAALALWRGDAYAEFEDEDWVVPEAQRLGELRLVAHELLFQAELACGRADSVIPEVEAMAEQHPLREAFTSQLMTALYRVGRQADALRAYRRHRDVLVDEMGLDPTPALQALEDRILAHAPELLAAEPAGQALRGYRLGERLGTGREGTVHAAHLPGVDRDLVIRVIRPEVADSPDFVRSFEATAQRIASLRHPAIVPIHDYWREPGAAYLVMRRMHGGSLADRLERLDRRPLSPAEVTAIVRRVGAALIEAGDAGLAHGRINPRNVLFDEAGDAWLSDFDLCAPAPARSRPADVGDLATFVLACLPEASGAVATAIEHGFAAIDRPAMDEYVPLLLAALTDGRVEGAAPTPNPYKGLRAFDETDADDFFGRIDVVDDLLRRLALDDLQGRLVLVVGGSGTGKSSVVRAGLLPRIRRGEVPGSEEWFVTTMLPGATPFKELAAALRRVAVTDADGVAGQLVLDGGIDTVVRRLLPPGVQLLLLIDQFEELFTSAPERDQRRFLDGLMHALSAPDSRLRLVGTLRADFYDRPLAFHPFGAAVNDATVTIPAMSASELEAAIVEPAERVGRHVDRALVAELVSAAVDEPAALPALQFTLFELAERTNGDLTLAAYRELGGLSGSIASRAETLYRSLDDDEHAAVRRLFGQLVVVHADSEPTRRRTTRQALTANDPGLDALIDRWADARLLSLDRHRQSRLPTVEPAHEALLREWPRLRRWIEEDRDALLVLGRLREAADTWVELDRDPGALYRGARLQVALDTIRSAVLAPQEREFLDSSLAARDAEEQEAAALSERQARANRRLRLQLVAIGIALIVALVGGFVALDQRGEAVQGREIAFARELAAAADASIEEDPERSLLLALEAIDVTGGGDGALPEAIGSLHEAISRSRVVLSVPGLGGSLDWSPDGSLFVTEGPEESGLIDLRDAETGESVRSWIGHEVDVNEVAFSADGEMLATSGDDGYLRVWDTSSGDEIAEFSHGGIASTTTFSPDGERVVGHWLDQEVTRVFDLRTGRMTLEIEWPQVHGAHFSPDGKQLALASGWEPGILVVDAASGDERRHLGRETDTSQDARFSPDGHWLASAHGDGLVHIWGAGDGDLQLTIAGHASEVASIAWSPDSMRLATAGSDGTARVHDLISGGSREAVVVSARDTANGIAAVDFSPEGDRIMTSDWANAAVKVWDVSGQAGAEWARISSATHGSGPAFLPDGRTVLVADPDGGVARWDVESGDRVGHDEVGDEVGDDPDAPLGFAVSADGSRLATVLYGEVKIWDLESSELVAGVPDTAHSWIHDLTWSPDSEHLAVAEETEGVARATVVDRSGELVARRRVEDGAWVHSVDFVGDGTQLVIGRTLARPVRGSIGIRVWDWDEDEIVREIELLAEDIDVDPMGRHVVGVELRTGTAYIFDLENGREVRTLRGAGIANGVEYSADGSQVAMAGADGTVRVFDAGSGRLEVILRGHERAVTAASFSPDGTRLVSLAEGGAVRVWALDVDELVSIARSRLTRTLDQEECRQYLREERCPDG